MLYFYSIPAINQKLKLLELVSDMAQLMGKI